MDASLREVFRQRDFVLYFAGQTTSRFGSSLVPVTTVFAVLAIDDSVVSIGLILAIATISQVVGLTVSGTLADRLPRRALMVCSDSVRIVSQVALALLFVSGNAQIWHLAALGAVNAIADAVFQPSAAGLLPALILKSQLRAGNGLLSTAYSAVAIAGPPAAGLLVTIGGPATAYSVDALSYFVSLICLIGLTPRAQATARRASIWASARDGWSLIRSTDWIWSKIAWDGLLGLTVIAPFLVLGPTVANEHYGGPGSWGLLLAMYSVGAVVGGLLSSRWQPELPLRMLAVLVPICLAVPLALLALTAPIAIVAVSQVFSGLATALSMSYFMTLLQQHIPEEMLSRVSAGDALASFALLPVGYILAGPLSEAVGVPATLLLGCTIALISCPLLLSLRGVRTIRFQAEAIE